MNESPGAGRVPASVFPGLEPGLRAEREYDVTEDMVTRHAGGPGVLTTPDMIGLMEDTAQEATRPYLPADHTTVGYEVSVRHRAPAPLGARVTVCAELLEIDGRRLLFRVEARQQRERVGEGTHRRTIVQIGSLARARPPHGRS